MIIDDRKEILMPPAVNLGRIATPLSNSFIRKLLRNGYASLSSGISTPVRLLAAIVQMLLLTEQSGWCDSKEIRSSPLAPYYGFRGVELFKLDARVFNLQAGDFNQDGLVDVMVVDNRESALQLLIQRPDSGDRSGSDGARVNDLRSDWRFETRPIPVDRQLAGMTTADLNGDGRLDTAYIGLPDQLMVRFQPKKGEAEWSQRWSVRLPGLKPASWMIASGDLYGDQRADLAVLGENVTYIVYQNSKNELDSPESLINTSSQLSMIQIADLNADGRQDLCYVANEGSTRGLCARLQTADGRLGPEISFDLQQPRAVTLQNIDQKPGHELITIESRTGRVVVSGLKPAHDEPGVLPTRLMQYGIGTAGTNKNRSVAAGDVDGDGLTDVIATDPDQAQILLYRQNGIDGLGVAEVFPSLVGTRDVCIADADADGHPDVILLSEKEGVLAICRFTEGRLTFPSPILRKPDGYELVAVRALPNAKSVQFVVGLVKGSGKSAKLDFRRLIRTDDGKWELVRDEGTSDIQGALGSRGTNLINADINGDGRTDIVAIPNGSSESGVQILLQNEDQSLKLVRGKQDSDLGITSSANVFPTDNRLLVARDTFARAMKFSASGWQVEDQFNAGETTARLEGVASLDLDGQDGHEIVLVDTGIRKLRVLRRHDGLYRPWNEVELGNLAFTSSMVADLNGDQRPDLLLAGAQSFSVLYSGRLDPMLTELASLRIERDEAYPADVIAGDVNGDGRADLTVVDTSINGVEILQFADNRLQPATHFRVFEEKRLVSESESRGTEPREGMVVDVTGDQRPDLLVLCHDRLIVYPQDTGEK
jgi:hypothetical protein